MTGALINDKEVKVSVINLSSFQWSICYPVPFHPTEMFACRFMPLAGYKASAPAETLWLRLTVPAAYSSAGIPVLVARGGWFEHFDAFQQGSIRMLRLRYMFLITAISGLTPLV